MAALLGGGALVVVMLVVLSLAWSMTANTSSAREPVTYPTRHETRPTRTTSAPRPPGRTVPRSGDQKEKEKEKKKKKQQERSYPRIELPAGPNNTDRAREMARNSAIYAEKISTAACSTMPDLSARPYATLSTAEMQTQLQNMADCAQDMWAEPAARAGFRATRAKVVVYDTFPTTPCGRPDKSLAGYYCSTTQQIYLHRDLGHTSPAEQGEVWGYYLEVLVHEYGHHVQARTGVLQGASYQIWATKNQDTALELRRRIELQASCFGGMALRRSEQVSRSQARTWSTRSRDSETHGSADHYRGWTLQGFRERKVSQCNTFRAPSSDVN